MLQLTHTQTTTLRDWFLPERPGPLIGPHVIATGHGSCWVDRWPAPRAVLVEAAGNCSLLGDAHELTPADLRHVKGFIDAAPEFVPLLRTAYPGLQVWPRIIFAPPESLVEMPHIDVPVRRLVAMDAAQLEGLGPEQAWIGKTWGGLEGLAQSGFAWGAFVDGELAAVACSFFVGETYEDIGVVTVPRFRRRGLSTACAHAMCEDVYARGRQPTWSTSTDNTASLRVAEKLGFRVLREDVLYVVGIEIPD